MTSLTATGPRQVLVTGGGGFLGKHLLRHLRQFHPDWSINVVRSRKDVDLTDEEQVRDLYTHSPRPDLIFHLAANPLTKLPADDPKGLALLDANLTATWNVVRYAPDDCVFVFASSATVYGDLGREIVCDEECLCKPTSLYGVSKLSAEVVVWEHRDRLRPVIARLVAQVGGGATHGLLLDLVNKARSSGRELVLFGDEPGSCKPFMYAPDTARILVELALRHHPARESGAIYNVAPRDSITVKDVAELVLSLLGDKPLRWLGRESVWKGDNEMVRVCNEKVRRAVHAWRGPDSKSAVLHGILDLITEGTK